MAGTVDETPTERAGVTQRLFVVAVAVAVAGLAATAPWLLPEKCRWVGWVCAGIFVPAGFVLAFQGVRGRAEDLRQFNPAKFAEDFAGELFGVAVLAAVVGLLSCLR